MSKYVEAARAAYAQMRAEYPELLTGPLEEVKFVMAYLTGYHAKTIEELNAYNTLVSSVIDAKGLDANVYDIIQEKNNGQKNS